MSDTDHYEDLYIDLLPAKSTGTSKQQNAARRNGVKFGKAIRAAAKGIPKWKRQLIHHRRYQTINKTHRLP